MAKILVIEDEKNLRLLYKQDLERDGYEVVTAGTAPEGIALVESEKPDLVVMDIRLPGMDGLEAMGKVLDKHPKLPVVLNSAYSSYQENFMSWAADAYVVKSADTDELRARVRELLDARQAG
jgi:two-component system response regulator (stage 0 sporulation protein F)